MNTLTELKTNKGYPHFLQFTDGKINLVSLVKHNVGDGFTFGKDYHNVDKSSCMVYRVAEILEERPPKAKKDGHPENAIFYSFKVVGKNENIKGLNLISSNR